jgi:hypothetical protein
MGNSLSSTKLNPLQNSKEPISDDLPRPGLSRQGLVAEQFPIRSLTRADHLTTQDLAWDGIKQGRNSRMNRPLQETLQANQKERWGIPCYEVRRSAIIRW